MSVTRNAAIAYVSEIRDIQELQHKDDQHTVPEWLIIIRHQLQKVEDAWYYGKKSEAIHRLGHIAACSLAAIEQCGESPSTERRPRAVPENIKRHHDFSRGEG